MKSFKTFVKEGHHAGGITTDIPPDFHMLDREDVRQRVNVWLEGCSNMEYSSVEAALTQLAGKVQQLGLTFNMTEQDFGSDGSITLNVHQFGEKLDPADTHVLDVSIPEDLSMTVDYQVSGSGGYRISAKLN